MTSALPAGVVTGLTTYASYLLAHPGSAGATVAQTQASPSALITLLIGALWVLATVARPYQWWRIALVAGAFIAYVAIFALPVTRRNFALDPSNAVATGEAVALGLLAAGLIEALWWVQGRILGEPRRVWR